MLIFISLLVQVLLLYITFYETAVNANGQLQDSIRDANFWKTEIGRICNGHQIMCA